MKEFLVLSLILLIVPAFAETHIIGPFNVSYDYPLNLTAQPPVEQESLQGIPSTCYELSSDTFRIYVSDDNASGLPGDVDLEPFLADRRHVASIIESDRWIDGHPGKIAELYYFESHIKTYIAAWWADYNAGVLVTSRLPLNQTSHILKTIHIERIS